MQISSVSPSVIPRDNLTFAGVRVDTSGELSAQRLIVYQINVLFGEETSGSAGERVYLPHLSYLPLHPSPPALLCRIFHPFEGGIADAIPPSNG